MKPRLSNAQQKLLAQAIAAGEVIVDGRRMYTAENLKNAGLATTKVWVEGLPPGGRWQVQVKPTTAGVQWMFANTRGASPDVRQFQMVRGESNGRG